MQNSDATQPGAPACDRDNAFRRYSRAARERQVREKFAMGRDVQHGGVGDVGVVVDAEGGEGLAAGGESLKGGVRDVREGYELHRAEGFASLRQDAYAFICAIQIKVRAYRCYYYLLTTTTTSHPSERPKSGN